MTAGEDGSLGAEDEVLLARIACGEIALGDPRVRALFERRPELAAEVAALRRTADEVRSAASRERETIDLARATTTPADRRRVADSLEAHLGSRRVAVPGASDAPAAARPRSLDRRWHGLAAAAVLAVLVAGGAYLAFRDRTPSGPVVMSGADVTPLAPTGVGQSFARFEWTGASAPGTWYEVVVSDERGEIARSPRLRTQRWEPPETTTSAWPDAIRWKVVRGSGATPGGASATVTALRAR